MATSLQRQLAQLAAPSTSILVPDRRRVSIIFTSSEAARYNRDTFYQIGLDGLQELKGINPTLFSPYFQSMIFNNASKSLERAVLDKDTNDLLDKVIDEFLVTLSPFMTIKAALKCMEWLVHRFHIDMFNVESIIRCVLPYYDTKTFVLVIQILHQQRFSEEQNKKWAWLIPSIQTSLPLTKNVLYSNINSSFVSWIFDTLDKFISVHHEHMENIGVYLAFFTSTILGILNNINQDKSSRVKISFPKKEAVTCTWKGISELLTSIANASIQANDDLHSAIHVVISMLIILAKESPQIGVYHPIQPVMMLLLKINPPALRKQGILLLNLAASASDRIFVNKFQKVFDSIASLSSEFDLWYCTSVLLKNHVAKLDLKPSKVWKLIEAIQLSPHQRAALLRDIYFICKRHEVDSVQKSSKLFISTFERQYPVEFSLACEADKGFAAELVVPELNIGTEHADSNLRKQAIERIFTIVKKRMKHEKQSMKENDRKDIPQKNKKGKLNKQLRKKKKNQKIRKPIVQDDNKYAHDIINRFDDDDRQVVKVILQQPVKVLTKIFSVRKLVEGLAICSKNKGGKCTRLAVKKICLVATKFWDKDMEDDVKASILSLCFPFLFPIKENGVHMAKIILTSPFAQKHFLFSNYSSVFSDDTKTVSPEDLCRLSFELISSEKPALNSVEWASEFLKNNNAFYALLAMITLQDAKDFEHIFRVVEQKDLLATSSYPVTSSNIFDEVQTAIRRKKVSLDLLLTSFFKLEIKDPELMHRIFNFVLLSSEKAENRNTCMTFLQEFIQKCFVKSSDLLQFWINMILENNKHDKNEDQKGNGEISVSDQSNLKSEYYQIRTLQFLWSIFQKLANTAAANEKSNTTVKAKEASREKQTPLIPVAPSTPQPRAKISTRHSIHLKEYQQSPPAKCTRSSIRIKIEKDLPEILSGAGGPIGKVDELEEMELEIPQPPEVSKTVDEKGKQSSRESKSKESYYKKETSGLVEVLLTQCVLHQSDHIRHWGLRCLKVLLQWEYLEEDWMNLIKYLLEYKKEIRADRNQLYVVVVKMLGESHSTKLQDRFVKIATDKEKVEAVRFGFLDLCSNGSLNIFNKLASHIKCLLKEEPSSKFLLAYLGTFDGSLKNMDIIKEALKYTETGKKILNRLTGPVFESCDVQSKKALFAVMINSSAKCESPELRVAIQKTVHKWILDASIITAELDTCLSIQQRQSVSNAEGTSNGKPTKIKQEQLDLSFNWVSRTEAVLEFAQSRKRLLRKTKLIKPLFKLLKICIALEEQTPVEYLKQLILTSLTIACEQEDESDYKSNSDDWVHFNVEYIIDCLRCSRNPQTHHHALILLNYAAKRYPEQVLHGVMSLFTFMGNSILRQDDAYSTQLIQQTVTTIIPTLATAGTVPQYSRSKVSAGIYRVFTSAVQDIPAHRRIPVFSSLIEVLNPAESMWQVCLIIVDNVLTKDKKRSTLNADIELATSLLWNFEPSIILQTLEKVYMYLTDLPIYDKKSSEEFSKRKFQQHDLSKAVVDLSRKQNLRDVQLIILYTLELVSKAAIKFAELEGRQLNYDTLLEKCLTFSRLVAGVATEDKIFRWAANRNFEVIERVNAALHPEEFVQVVNVILSRDDLNIKKKILDILNQRILQKLDWFGDTKVLLKLLPALVQLGSNLDPVSDDVVTLIQTAFLSLKLIAKNLAGQYPDDFVDVFNLCQVHAPSKNRLLSSSALLCLGELFCLKSIILPQLNDVMRVIKKAFRSASKMRAEIGGEDDMDIPQVPSDGEEKKPLVNTENNTAEVMKEQENLSVAANLLLISGITCLNKLVEQLGPFVGSKFLSKCVVSILKMMDGRFGKGEKAENRKKVFEHKLKILMKTVATKIPLRNSLVAIKKSFGQLVGNSDAVIVLLRLLRDSLLATDKPDFVTLLPSLCDAFLEEFLVYREQVSSIDELEQGAVVNYGSSSRVEVDAVEDAILDSLVSGIVLKVSEGTFRPLYHRVFDWTGESMARRITFYRFSFTAAEKLKSLFVTFAGHVIGQAAESLSTAHQNVELTQAILKYFYHIFSHDREGFVTTDRFNILVKPLVDLIETQAVISNQITIKELNDTIIQLAVATNDLNRWQHLIELISLKTQNEDSKVRLFVISTLEAIANELEKDFLPLLPPAIPFLAELLGDDDETVEAETKKMLLKLENIVGEPLQPYFDT